jgi:predicted anti-sigma-YlaC factor YlaD
MKTAHVIGLFVDWQEGRLSGKRQAHVESHLQRCDQCRRSYNGARLLFDSTSLQALPRLSPDPYLPARIRAHLQHRHGRDEKRVPRYQWALTSIGIAAAIWLGIQLGAGLSGDSGAVSDSDLASAYYSAFSQEEPAEEWEQGTPTEGEQQ